MNPNQPEKISFPSDKLVMTGYTERSVDYFKAIENVEQ